MEVIAGSLGSNLAAGVIAAYCVGCSQETSLETGRVAALAKSCGFALRSSVGRGKIEVYQVGPLTCLGAPGLPLKSAHRALQSGATEAPLPVDGPPPFVGCGRSLAPPCAYTATVVDGELRIPQEQVPAFFADNGVALPSAAETSAAVAKQLSENLAPAECQVLVEYSFGGAVLGATPGWMRRYGGQKLRPGDIAISIHLDMEFSRYTEDPVNFVDTLKAEVLRSLGLDPEKVPNAKRFLRVLEVREGSVVVDILIVGCVFAAATFVSYLASYPAPAAPPQAEVARESVEAPPSAVLTPTSQPTGEEERGEHRNDLAGVRRVQLAEARFVNYPDGRFEICGRPIPEQQWYVVEPVREAD